MAELDRTSLCNFVHIQPQISNTLNSVRLHQNLESTITDFVDSKVQDLQVRQHIVISYILRSFWVNIVATQINLSDVFQTLRPKNVSDALVFQVVSGQLQVFNIWDKIGSRDLVQVSEVHNWDIFSLESLNILLKYKLADLVDNAVLLLIIEKEI